MNKRIIAFVLAGVFAASVVVNPLEAVTLEELQTLYNDLLAKYELLLAQVGQPTTTTGLCLSSDLKLGMTSAEVKSLQQGLNQDTATQVAVSGAGAPGYETTYFGALTKAAVIKFQEKYASEVLASWGLTKGTGYAGSTTRAKFNALYCTPVTTTTTVPETTTTTVAPAEGSLTVTQNPIPGSGTVTVYGGDTNREIAAYKIKATNSDVRLKRVLLQFGITSDFPWRDLTAISLWDGTTLLKEISASQANWTEVTFATTYTMQFDGLDVLVAKDTEKVLSLKATAVSVPQYIGNITVLIPVNGVRGVDTAGLNVYSPTALAAHTFATAAAQAPTLTVTSATDSPLAGNVIASLTSITRAELMKISAAVAGVDMTFKGGAITLTTDSGNIVSGLELYDGSTLLASAADPGQGNTATWSTFTLPVTAGTTKVFTVKVVLPANPAAGSQISVNLPVTAGLTGIDSNGTARNNGTQAITGNVMRVYTIAPVFTYITSGVTVKGSNSQTNPNDIGDSAITFSVTANGGDIYIPQKANATDTLGIIETLTGGTATTTTSTTWTCSSPAVSAAADDATANQLWRIPSGQTANCTFSTLVTNTGGTANYFSVAVGHVKWDTNNEIGTGLITQTWGLTNIKTADFYLGI